MVYDHRQWCVSHGSITVQSIMTDTGKAYDVSKGEMGIPTILGIGGGA